MVYTCIGRVLQLLNDALGKLKFSTATGYISETDRAALVNYSCDLSWTQRDIGKPSATY
jgi:hypothetical protein